MTTRIARQADHCVTESVNMTRRNHRPISVCALPPVRGVRRERRLIHDDSCKWPGVVKHTDARRKPRQMTRGICRSIDRVDDRKELSFRVMYPALFREHSKSTGDEVTYANIIGHEIAAV